MAQKKDTKVTKTEAELVPASVTKPLKDTPRARALEKLAETPGLKATNAQVVGQSIRDDEITLLVDYGIKGIKKFTFTLDEL